jgi:hypothetical protein
MTLTTVGSIEAAADTPASVPPMERATKEDKYADQYKNPQSLVAKVVEAEPSIKDDRREEYQSKGGSRSRVFAFDQG